MMSRAMEELARKWAKEDMEEVRLESAFCHVKSLMVNLKLTAEQAMAAMELSDGERAALRARF